MYPAMRSLYSASLEVVVDCSDDEVLVQQHMAEETNINFIVKKYGVGVVQMSSSMRPGQYGDAAAVDSLHTALNLVKAGESDFAALPADVRRRFEDKPLKFMEFVNDPANLQAGADIGLWTLPKVDPGVPPGSKEPEATPVSKKKPAPKVQASDED